MPCVPERIINLKWPSTSGDPCQKHASSTQLEENICPTQESFYKIILQRCHDHKDKEVELKYTGGDQGLTVKCIVGT